MIIGHIGRSAFFLRAFLFDLFDFGNDFVQCPQPSADAFFPVGAFDKIGL
jgi:hypothetical protein